ncbi:MAG TPA: M20/M25/M40 family metallo-hydrolase [Micromonosporaceae bacterium]|nr:M20/M25/M40 family metallo-hydrolase [Micromonosporaceae bacterium]
MPDPPAMPHLSTAHDVTAMLDDLATLVATESPSADTAATAACAEVVAELGVRLLGAVPERVVVAGHTHLRWRFGSPPTRVVLIGHLDTVWPLGTVARWPFAVHGERVTGPGVVDMKAGLVQLFHGLASVGSLAGVAVLVTSDEELGSPSSRELIEETARGADAALVLEGTRAGTVKTARKGIAQYRLSVTGRAAHAGIEPHKGVNAGVELAHQILAIAALADGAAGTTVTPTVAQVGTTANTIPAGARLHVDVRAFDPDELARVDAALAALTPRVPGAALELERGPRRPAMPESASATLLPIAQQVAADLGLPPLRPVAVGGGSDGNLTAGIGVPTLDGLGPVGGNAHAEGEWADVPEMPRRAALLAGLVSRLLDGAGPAGSAQGGAGPAGPAEGGAGPAEGR